MSYQLNLLSGEPEPITASHRRSPTKSRVIKSCTTKQAAILLDVSVSTLYRARQADRVYSNAKTGWIAKPKGFKSWEVLL
jgi:hypothetical protein